MNKFIALTYY